MDELEQRQLEIDEGIWMIIFVVGMVLLFSLLARCS
jgi:hypothetical protein